jgi:hypothetical protein
MVSEALGTDWVTGSTFWIFWVSESITKLSCWAETLIDALVGCWIEESTVLKITLGTLVLSFSSASLTVAMTDMTVSLCCL